MQLDVSEGETAVEVPTELFEHLTNYGLPAGEIRSIEDPIVILTPSGTFVVQGREMTDPAALAQMEDSGLRDRGRGPQGRDHRPTGGTAWS
ncbi:hypothetical protein ACFU7X_14020 [Streptomyces chartreusis]|uniref:hypothetical protein n=1 Tax=Streptomyces chartreusis TaxID=1969 RepID=UPI00369C7F58